MTTRPGNIGDRVVVGSILHIDGAYLMRLQGELLRHRWCSCSSSRARAQRQLLAKAWGLGMIRDNWSHRWVENDDGTTITLYAFTPDRPGAGLW